MNTSKSYIGDNNEKVYDIGETRILVTLEEDLSLTKYDIGKGKYIGKLPNKKGANKEIIEEIQEDVRQADIEVKRVYQNKIKTLFQCFLHETPIRVESFRETYLSDIVLRKLASELVWKQGTKTFTVLGNQLIKWDGSLYQLSEEDIYVAHPIRVAKDQLEMWRNYFKVNKVKQPFVQVEEKAYDIRDIDEDRYEKYTICAEDLLNRQHEGIVAKVYNDFDLEVVVEFEDCDAFDRLAYYGYTVDDYYISICDFHMKKYTPIANHVIYILDELTGVLYGR